jgi:hypothetical protein
VNSARQWCIAFGDKAITGGKREAWILARQTELLPVPYYHVVFTLPAELNALCLFNQKAMYNLLFGSAWSFFGVFRSISCRRASAACAITASSAMLSRAVRWRPAAAAFSLPAPEATPLTRQERRAEALHKLVGHTPDLCPHCRNGRMVKVGFFPPQRAPPEGCMPRWFVFEEA